MRAGHCVIEWQSEWVSDTGSWYKHLACTMLQLKYCWLQYQANHSHRNLYFEMRLNLTIFFFSKANNSFHSIDRASPKKQRIVWGNIYHFISAQSETEGPNDKCMLQWRTICLLPGTTSLIHAWWTMSSFQVSHFHSLLHTTCRKTL